MVAVIDLGRFAKILCWHSWLKQRHGWSIQIKFSRNSDLKLLRLVCEVLFVVVGLDFEMLTAVGWLGGRNVAVRVLKHWTFRLKLPLKA